MENRSSEIISSKVALGNYFWKVLKNCSNEIRSNEIPIRRGLPVHILVRHDTKIIIILANAMYREEKI